MLVFVLLFFQACSVIVSQGNVTGSCPKPLVTSQVTINILEGTPFKTDLVAHGCVSGGVAPYHFKATSMPDWASLTDNGILSGTAPTQGSFNVSYTVTDSAGVSIYVQ